VLGETIAFLLAPAGLIEEAGALAPVEGRIDMVVPLLGVLLKAVPTFSVSGLT
jgi:hypothetical protein